jgi:hypothetical protein
MIFNKLQISMNFKAALFLAGALAAVSASSFQESTQELAQAECHPGYSRCTRCFGAAKKRANRYRAIVNWRNSQNKANVAWYHRHNRVRVSKVRYWSNNWYRAQYKRYIARHRYISKRYAQLIAYYNRLYANCQ